MITKHKTMSADDRIKKMIYGDDYADMLRREKKRAKATENYKTIGELKDHMIYNLGYTKRQTEEIFSVTGKYINKFLERKKF